ncbi:MAG: type VI secretion system-associated FHA domain protein TagH [Chromatiaceae bacterium]|nr:type VI secretion system-associated FHA domain protein TagH [Chromatiaceae bacterium]
MELSLEIVACHGDRPDSPTQQSLNSGSCTLGRTPDNDVVLADTERTVSSRHARVDVTGSEVRLTDLSTNGTFLNNLTERLPRDQPTRLSDGDRLFIGPYEIAVSIRSGVIDEDIFGFDQPTASSSTSAGTQGSLLNLIPGTEADAANADILDLLGESHNASSSSGALGAAEEAFADARPLDELLTGPTEPQSVPDFAESRPTPVDQVFFRPPETAAIPDGYDLLSDAEPETSPSTAPPPRPSPGGGRRAAAEPSSIDRLGAAVDPPKVESLSDVASAAEGLPSDRVSVPDPAAHSGAAPTQPAAPGAPSRGALSAFLSGLGSGDPSQIADQEAFLRSAGALLRVLVGGLSASLVTRAQFKSELRLGVTTIRAAENNPFKFSVSPDDALDRLLFRPNPGFLPPLKAAQQGFDDIQAHEMAMIAGLRSALRALLARFDPETIEAKLIDSGLDKVLPMVRKSRCWDEFTETYARALSDASEDFTELFGEAFTRAYDDQILRLARSRRESG